MIGRPGVLQEVSNCSAAQPGRAAGWSEEKTIRRVFGNGRPVLSDTCIVRLVKYLWAVKSHFYFNYYQQTASSFTRFAMDVEFKFLGDTLYLKQARPYQ